MMTAPGETPVTVPEEVTVATAEFVLLHEPPDVESSKVVALAWQSEVAPVMDAR